MTLLRNIIACALILPLHPVLANSTSELNTQEHECYTLAMVGYDHVINSRVGVPIKHSRDTMSVNHNSPDVRETYKLHILDVVDNAYAWEASPHEYAVKVLYGCGKRDGQSIINMVQNDVDTIK